MAGGRDGLRAGRGWAGGRSLSEELTAARRFRAQAKAAGHLDLLAERRASEEVICDRRIEAWSEAMAKIEAELRSRAPQAALPVVTELTRTTIACPTQWEGTLDDGRALYARYHHGLLRVGAGVGPKAAWENSQPEGALYCERLGPCDDVGTTFAELKRSLRGVIEFPEGLVVAQHPDWGEPGPANDS